MLEANFYLNTNPDFKNKPTFSFISEDENKKYWMLYELEWCDADYIINNVVPNLEKVLAGELKVYEFGYDATIIDFYSGKALIHYNFDEDEME